MADFQTLTLTQTVRLLIDAETPLFIMHRRPDGDTAGSTVALIHIARALGKTAYGICEDKIPDRLHFLTEELPMLRTLPDFPFTPIAVDVASPSQLGAVDGMLKQAGIPIRMMIDHHAVGEPFADHYIIPTAAAAGEAVFRIAQEMIEKGYLSALPPRAARALYAALSSDTGCFRYSNVTPTTLRTAAALLECETVDAADINHLLFEAKSDLQLRAEAFAIEQTKASRDGKIAWVIITQKDKKALGVEEEHLETVIDMVRSRAGVEIAVAIRETPTGTFRASMRSNGFNVASIATVFGGGGHTRAAGCTVEAADAEDALSRVLAAIEKRVKA